MIHRRPIRATAVLRHPPPHRYPGGIYYVDCGVFIVNSGGPILYDAVDDMVWCQSGERIWRPDPEDVKGIIFMYIEEKYGCLCAIIGGHIVPCEFESEEPIMDREWFVIWHHDGAYVIWNIYDLQIVYVRITFEEHARITHNVHCSVVDTAAASL